MSERDMLPRRPYAVVAPEPRGFDEAMARARRRRRRTAGTGVVASITAVLLAISLTASTPDTEARLEITQPTDPQEAVDDTSPADEATAALAPDSPADRADDSVGRAPSGEINQSPVATTAPAAASPARPVPPARPTTGPRPRQPDPPTERTTADVGSCNRISAGQPWCLFASRAPDADFEKSGNSTLSISVCLARVVTEARTLSFAGEQQVDFVITKKDSEEVLWRWSYRAAFDDEPTRDDVRPGECRVYSVPWLAQSDNDGDYIDEAGTYVLTASQLARELTTNTSTYTFDLNR